MMYQEECSNRKKEVGIPTSAPFSCGVKKQVKDYLRLREELMVGILEEILRRLGGRSERFAHI